MKTKLLLLVVLLVTFPLIACSSEEETTLASSAKIESINYDLTKLSATMIYAQVFDLLGDPEKYLNKTFKFVGEYDSMYVESLKEEIHFLIIYDATSCCPQGLEIELNDDVPVPQIGELVTAKAKLVKENSNFMRYYMQVYSIKDAN